jgi:hypothetical protein
MSYEIKGNYLSAFIRQLSGGYREYYAAANINMLGNDSFFMAYFERETLEKIALDIRKEEYLNRGWKPPPENLFCEPEENFQRRLKEMANTDE